MDETLPPPDESSGYHYRPQPAHGSDSNISSQPERFAPGFSIDGRYRIVSRLGRGGMGEVYRADDQRLGTSVALKFLPASRSLDPVWRDRLLREVKVAREVTHPNVCRVFDLAEHDGQFFLSMEYIDGEDLSSLLLRIGRFPEDKALEIARQICLGLAAAHEEGVLHRDLKPANVMLDGRGRIKITDFGLAALTEKLEGPESRSGTLAYMAPEQIEGREVTRKSDIYSLGLVLYEVFTGKTYDPGAIVAAGSKRGSATRSAQGSHASSSGFVLDPAISRVLTRCLRHDPTERPNTAFAVAAALPGGDPLQAALAAGETPSPEMVAEAGGNAAFSKPLLNASLVTVFVCAFVSFWIWDAIGIACRGNLSKSPEALMELSHQAVKEMGYGTNAVDSVGWLEALWGTNRQYSYSTSPDEFRRRLKAEFPATWSYTYRQSSAPLAPIEGNFTEFDINVPEAKEGDIVVQLSGSGDLTFFEVTTGPWSESNPSSTTQPVVAPPVTKPAAAPVDLPMLSRLTGLPLSKMSPVPAIYQSREHVDERLAWVGKYPAPNDLPVRVEAGRLGGRMIYVKVISPWDLPRGEQAAMGYQLPQLPALHGAGIFFAWMQRIIRTSGYALMVAVILACAYLAVQHMRNGIADIRSGTKLATFAFAVLAFSWLLATHFPSGVAKSAEHLINGLGYPAIFGLMIFASYIALEPFVRSHWPEKLIAWSRVLEGRHGDRFVSGEILIGIAGGSICRVLCNFPFYLMTNVSIYNDAGGYESFPHALAEFSGSAIGNLNVAFLIVFAIALIRKWVGKTWLSFLLAFPVIFMFVNLDYFTPPTWLGLLPFLLPVLIIMATISRFGLLALVICCCTYEGTSSIPMTLSTDSYWWPSAAALIGVVLSIALLVWKRAIPASRGGGSGSVSA